jgi:hypothetical protein
LYRGKGPPRHHTSSHGRRRAGAIACGRLVCAQTKKIRDFEESETIRRKLADMFLLPPRKMQDLRKIQQDIHQSRHATTLMTKSKYNYYAVAPLLLSPISALTFASKSPSFRKVVAFMAAAVGGDPSNAL